MNKKDAICDAAIKVIMDKGYSKTNIQDIAEVAGIGKGTIYLYYTSKEEILEYVICSAFDNVIEYLIKLQNADLSPLVKIELFIRFLTGKTEESLNVLTIFKQGHFFILKSNEKINSQYNKVSENVISIIEDGQKNGEIKLVDPSILNYIVFDLSTCVYCEVNTDDPTDLELKRSQVIYTILETLKA